jgi:hypothetical protein
MWGARPNCENFGGVVANGCIGRFEDDRIVVVALALADHLTELLSYSGNSRSISALDAAGRFDSPVKFRCLGTQPTRVSA